MTNEEAENPPEKGPLHDLPVICDDVAARVAKQIGNDIRAMLAERTKPNG